MDLVALYSMVLLSIKVSQCFSHLEIKSLLLRAQTTTQTNTHIITDSLNNIYLISNHIQHPTSQHHHPDKLLIAAIIHQIYWTPHLIHIHKVRAHTGITGNEIADTLANEGALKEKHADTPHIHIAHATPYWLASCPTATRDGAIRNLHTFVIKEHNYREVRTTQHKYPYVEKWLSNDQIHQKLSNHLWKNNQITDAQITQILKFRYAQYMGNHLKTSSGPSNSRTPTAHYATKMTETHGHIYYSRVNIHTSKDLE